MAQYLRTAQVSERTGLSESTLRYWRHRGEGPPSFKLGRKNVVYPVDKLALWIANREAATTKGDTA